MDWQDELRTLDAKVAEGAISQAEYRKLRDQVLAEASSGGPVHRPAGPEHHDRVHIPLSAAEEDPSGEMTQVISGEQAADETLRTETAPPAPVDAQAPAEAQGSAQTPAPEPVQASRPVQTIQPVQPLSPMPAPEADADKTMVVGPQKTSLASAFQQGPNRTPAPPTPPPPPLPWETTGHGSPVPPVQGNEVFSRARKQSGGKKAVLGSLAVLLVLALVGAGIWWFLLRDDAKPDQAGGPAPVTTTTTTTNSVVPQDTDPGSQIPALPGVANANDGTLATDKAVQLKIIAPAEASLIKKQGTDELIFRGSTGEATGYSLIAVQGKDAKKTTDALSGYLTQNGFKPAGTLDGGYQIVSAKYGDVTVYRTVYTSGKLSVRIGVSRKGGDDKALRGDLTKALGTVAKALPRG